ncbi:MAG: hypothetical protein AAGD11_07515 [Planctomycetota bacterium]
MSWYARTGPRYKQRGKFQSALIPGVENLTGAEYRGWHYRFVTHQTGSGVKRMRYSASILDGNHNRVAYLRDCASIQQATAAAKHWIDETIAQTAASAAAKSVGTIPTLPEFVQAQEK